MTLCRSFPPAGSKDPFVLILGTMPGPVSLQKNQYYGHPQNSFWKIMGDLFGASCEMPYDERLKILDQKRIGLWETLKSCKRPGSADSAIREKIPNDFNRFFKDHPNAAHLFFDGQMAYKTFQKLIVPSLKKEDLFLTALPSTSPRNASMNYSEKLKAWAAVKDSLEA